MSDGKVFEGKYSDPMMASLLVGELPNNFGDFCSMKCAKEYYYKN
jgi:hypothetical protein